MFDFNKVKEFYKRDIPNFDLMLKIHEVEYPQNNSELCTFLFKMLELFFKSMNYSSVLYKTDAHIAKIYVLIKEDERRWR